MSKINTDWMSEQEKSFFLRKMNLDRKPHFSFKNIPSSDRLEYELVDEENYKAILDLFNGDENPFVSDSYKTAAKLDAYAFYLIHDTKYSTKRAGCDWLFKTKENGEYVGLLNMYDMSRENFADYNKQCTIGFSTTARFRRRGFTTEAVQSLVKHIFKEYPIQQRIFGYTEKENIASQNLLRKLGFTKPQEEFFLNATFSYFELWRKV